MDEQIFQVLCEAAAKKAIDMLTKDGKMRTEETAFCKAVVEMAGKLWDMDLINTLLKV